MPERFESGTLNTPGIAGLKAGVDFINATGIDVIRRKESLLISVLHEGLSGIDGVKIYGPADFERHCGPLSFYRRGIRSV